jgi:hypothetical protein
MLVAARALRLLLVSIVIVSGCNRTSDSQPSSQVTVGATSSSSSTLKGVARADATVPVSRPKWAEVDDPRRDGWDTEVLSSKAETQLKLLGKLLTHPGDINRDAVIPLFDSRATVEALIPPQLHTVYSDGPLTVERPVTSPEDGADAKCRGTEAAVTALRLLTQSTDNLDDKRIKFKVFRVHRGEQTFTTQQYVTIFASSAEKSVEQNASWTIQWSLPAGEAAPRVRDIDVTAFEQITRLSPRWFADCTEAVIGADPSFRTQLRRGYGDWLERIPHGIYLEVVGTPGIALGDVNGDGLEDLYLCQENGLPNRLFIQQSDGTMRDAAEAWGVDWLESSRAALLVDLDNDGDQDLVVSVMGGVVVASNEGQTAFQFRRLLATTEDVMSLAAADYDNDSDVDIYVCGYYANKTLDRYGNAGTSALPTGDEGFVMHDANVGGPNHLLRNDFVQHVIGPTSAKSSAEGGAHESADEEGRVSTDHDWSFTDVTQEVGLDMNNRRFSFAAAWEDFDNDGDQDLYVVNEFGRDNLYRNDNGRFADISDEARVEDAGSGMGITWGDYDLDGLMDVYISNMFSAAGNRVTYQDKFKADAPYEVKQRIQRLARGNTLLQNDGEGGFRDQSGPAGVEMGRWSWDSKFVDLNNDGWLDLLVANGYITAGDEGDL